MWSNNICVCLLILQIISRKYVKSNFKLGFLTLLSILYIIFIAISRMILVKHNINQILFGFLLGIWYFTFFFWVFPHRISISFALVFCVLHSFCLVFCGNFWFLCCVCVVLLNQRSWLNFDNEQTKTTGGLWAGAHQT